MLSQSEKYYVTNSKKPADEKRTISSAIVSIFVLVTLRLMIPTRAKLRPANVPLVERSENKKCGKSLWSLTFFSIGQLPICLSVKFLNIFKVQLKSE